MTLVDIETERCPSRDVNSIHCRPMVRPSNHQAGFTYMVVLAACFVMGLGLAQFGSMWRAAAQRDKELELLFVGREYRRAVESYARQSPGTPELPKTLEDLLEDRRFPVVRRHLRRLYRDPMTGSNDWEILRQGDRILGVRSRSKVVPFRKKGFLPEEEEFEEAGSYADWRFSYKQPVAIVGPGTVGSSPPPGNSAPPPATGAPVPETSAPVPPPPRKSPAECGAARSQDLAVCNAGRSFAQNPRVRECAQSATARFAACLSGAAPPDLIRP